MTYEEIVNIIDNKNRFGKACGRDITRCLLEQLGHPEMGMHIIHIAGTNGKGSVAAFVSSILQAASFASKEHFKVGLFTSPHLINHTERIQIDGRQIPKEDVVRLGQKLLSMELDRNILAGILSDNRKDMEVLQSKIEPTMLDYWLAMALLYFKEQGVEYVVLETGLGGALDSTNGLKQYPEVCAITSIGLEHTQFLGDTVEKIAGEKAGIIKPQVPVVIGQMPINAADVIADRCKQLNCSIVQATAVSEDKMLGLFGGYQRKNAAVAVEIVNQLKTVSTGICGKSDILTSPIIDEGLKNAHWPGRMQILSQKPYVLIDGAHNPSGVQALYDSLVTEFPNEKFSFIMAVMADKDYMEMVHILAPIAKRIYTVTLDMGRALQAKELAGAIADIGILSKACDTYEGALEQAIQLGDRIIVCGSLYFIGQVLKNNVN